MDFHLYDEKVLDELLSELGNGDELSNFDTNQAFSLKENDQFQSDSLSDNSSVSEKNENKKRRSHSIKENRKAFKTECNGKIEKQNNFPLIIMKTDPRREYAIAWANIFNSCDYNMMMAYLNKYHPPDFLFIQHQKGTCSYEIIPEIRGIYQMSVFWYKIMCISPDIVCSLVNPTLKVKSDGTATISSYLRLKGNKVIPFDQKEENMLNCAIDAVEKTKLIEKQENKNLLKDSTFEENELSDYGEEKQDKLMTVKKPYEHLIGEIPSPPPVKILPIEVPCAFTMYLDTDSRIYLMEFYHY